MLNALLLLAASMMPQQHTVSFRALVTNHVMGTIAPFQVPQFDPSLGTLVKVESWTDFTLTKNDAVEALCSCDQQICVDFDTSGSYYGVVSRLPSPLFTFLSEDDVSPTGETICATGPFDGTDDFMGPSSTVGATETTMKTGTPYSYPNTDFNYFTGTGEAQLDSYLVGITYASIEDNPKCPEGADWLPLNIQTTREIHHIRYTFQ